MCVYRYHFQEEPAFYPVKAGALLFCATTATAPATHTYIYTTRTLAESSLCWPMEPALECGQYNIKQYTRYYTIEATDFPSSLAIETPPKLKSHALLLF